MTTGDFRRGTVTATYRRCGKANCVCASPGHPGHGPRHLLTRSLNGKTRAVQLSAGALDDELGVTTASMSPGLAATIAGDAAAGPFAKGSDLLAELAAVAVSAKRVARHGEAYGETLARLIAADAAANKATPSSVAAPACPP